MKVFLVMALLYANGESRIVEQEAPDMEMCKIIAEGGKDYLTKDIKLYEGDSFNLYCVEHY